MRNSGFASSICPVARTLSHVGDGWSLLILRDAFLGRTRFDEFRTSLGVAPNILAQRLGRLVEAGFLERRRYSERPPRDEYRLTARGRDFRPVMDALYAFGERNLTRESPLPRDVGGGIGG
ncbi:MAG: helix-turn-helix transcriptional regulator [Proteobacteria bacterium]|nr:helix-turn-helix transcriptional regulator [Pseudomonadota bacterium]